MNKIKKIGAFYALSTCMFLICLGCFVLFLCLSVGPYSFVLDTKEEKAYWTLFFMGFVLLIVTVWFCLGYIDLRQTTSTENGGDVVPQLIELNEIVYPDGGTFCYIRIRRQIQELKSKELESQLEINQTQLTRLITNLQLQNKVNNDTEAILDLYLQAHAQMIAQNKEDDTFAQAQLTNFENTLQNNLTQEELQTLRTCQREILVLEQHLNKLRELLGEDALFKKLLCKISDTFKEVYRKHVVHG